MSFSSTIPPQALKASARAIQDAGLNPRDIDGIIPSYPYAVENFIVNLGIQDLRYSATIHMGGASPVAGLQTAAMAVTSGIANNVLIFAGRNGASGPRIGERTIQPGYYTAFGLVTEFEMPFGSTHPAQWYALMARRHMYEYGTTSRQFGAVAVAMRKHAILNDNAIMKEPITIEDHQNSRMVADPFRLLDCCVETDGAAAVVVTSAGRARDTNHQPVYIMGIAEGHPDSPDDLANRKVMTDLGVKKAAPKAFAMAGVGPEDIDVAEIYDCFTWNVICELEDIGFCKKGEGGSFVEEGKIELGGELPVNTHGGLLSQGHLRGMSHIVEGVKQLRDDAGAAQVTGAKIALVSGYGDLGDGSLAILRR